MSNDVLKCVLVTDFNLDELGFVQEPGTETVTWDLGQDYLLPDFIGIVAEPYRD